MSKSLDDYAKENSKFLNLLDGESFEGKYIGYKIVPNSFDPEKETVVYELQYKSGQKIFFKTASAFCARMFGKIKSGDEVKLTRVGTGTTTRYKFSSPAIQVANAPVDEPDEEIPF